MVIYSVSHPIVVYIAISKKVVIVNSQILVLTERDFGYSIISDNMPVKVVTVWPLHYDEPALDILQSQC